MVLTAWWAGPASHDDRRYLRWRTTHATDPTLRKVVRPAAIITKAKVA